MFDFGESRYAGLEVDLVKYEDTLPYVDCETIRVLSVVCRGGVNGEEPFVSFAARLVVRFRGEGVSGMRPPAVRVEKMPWWLFRGVDTEAVAILLYEKYDRKDN